MKKTLLFVAIIFALATMSFTIVKESNSLSENLALVRASDSDTEAYVMADELGYDGEDFTERQLTGYTAEGEANGTGVEICPGKGVPCRVIVIMGSEVIAYSGSKGKGKPDVVVSAFE